MLGSEVNWSTFVCEEASLYATITAKKQLPIAPSCLVTVGGALVISEWSSGSLLIGMFFSEGCLDDDQANIFTNSSASCKYRVTPHTLSRDVLIGCGFLPSPLSSYIVFLINKSVVHAWDFPLTSSHLALFYFGTIYDRSNCLPSSSHRMSFERTNTLFLQRLVFIGLKALTGTMNLINPLIAPGDN